MGTVIKWLLVVLVVLLIVVAGYFLIRVATGGQGVEDLVTGEREGSITMAQFRSVKRGTSRTAMMGKLGKPAGPQTLEREIPVEREPANTVCSYYVEPVPAGQSGRLFQFCFRSGKLHSKRAF